ncbi:HAMP domain-containing histidine kinase [Candidatus Saccharibacteria bacterium]|nr:HAMP domain-containing histidine kinase [Candidatus Saccharibacteria bacterium]MCL1962771.1 HAMP domain-containing histidine kinase [Candidatus Saccharibacteria bacterium]
MNEARGELLGGETDFFGVDFAPSLIAAAHELKSPLVLLRQLTFQIEDDKDSKTVRRMRLTTERALRLADNLTKAARLDDAMFSCEPIQLSNLCAAAIEEMQPLADALAVKIRFRPTRISRIAIGNRELLHALLVGLIDNALHYANGKSIEVATRFFDNKMVVSVSDAGNNISLDEFRKLKNAIGRTNLPLSSRPLSSGLGLMIATKFAAAMNGQLSVKRRAAGGMTFMACLPTSQQLSLLEL